MPLDINRLQALMTESAGELATRYADNPVRFVREMERTITRGHTAAYVGATADRLGVSASTIKGLSREERKQLDQFVKSQRPYLTGFASDMRAGNLTDDQIRRRAELYAGPIRLTYSKTRYPNLPAHPADGSSECLAWCKCTWLERDGQMHWTLGDAEHCPTCQTRASEWNPYKE